MPDKTRPHMATAPHAPRAATTPATPAPSPPATPAARGDGRIEATNLGRLSGVFEALAKVQPADDGGPA